ncbi:hypothetical protein EJV47_27740, partial [Hymenobacter gummosus]
TMESSAPIVSEGATGWEAFKQVLSALVTNPGGTLRSLAATYPAIIMSISQISETLFILAIPFFLRRFGIKQVRFFSMLAWVLRFGLFAIGDLESGLWMIILSCI